MIPLVLVLAMPAAQRLVDLVHEQIDRLVHFLGVCGAVDVRSANLDMGLGDKLVRALVLAIAFQLHLDAYDVFLVSEQSLGLLNHVILERRGQFEMNAGNNHLVSAIRIIHVGDQVEARWEKPGGKRLGPNENRRLPEAAQ